jgi:hypothetical protein
MMLESTPRRVESSANQKEENHIMARSNKQKSKGKGKARRTGPVISYKDVFLAYCMGGRGRKGINAVKKLEEDKGVTLTSNVLWAAHDSLAESEDEHLEMFEAFTTKAVGPRSSGTGRGRSTPQVGETRDYKAMTTSVKDDDGNETGRSDPFVRIPVSALGIDGGAQLSASFEDGKIVLTPGA